MSIIYLDDLIKTSFNPFEGKIVDIKILKLFKVVDKLNRLFKKKYKRYYLFRDKVYIY